MAFTAPDIPDWGLENQGIANREHTSMRTTPFVDTGDFAESIWEQLGCNWQDSDLEDYFEDAPGQSQQPEMPERIARERVDQAQLDRSSEEPEVAHQGYIDADDWADEPEDGAFEHLPMWGSSTVTGNHKRGYSRGSEWDSWKNGKASRQWMRHKPRHKPTATLCDRRQSFEPDPIEVNAYDEKRPMQWIPPLDVFEVKDFVAAELLLANQRKQGAELIREKMQIALSLSSNEEDAERLIKQALSGEWILGPNVSFGFGGRTRIAQVQHIDHGAIEVDCTVDSRV